VNKYHARKTPYEGYVFDSGKECQRYKDLRLLEFAGEITDLTVHPKFVLQEGFIDRDGKKIRPITYSADFRYQRREGNININGDYFVTPVVEDVKGVQTQLFKVKWKWVKKLYPHIDFRIVEE